MKRHLILGLLAVPTLVATIAGPMAGSAVAPDRRPTQTVPVTRVASVGMTVDDMDRSLAFYTRVLPFRVASDVEVDGRAQELLRGVFGARLRVVRLVLGNETLELTEFLAPKGRGIPSGMRANDLAFQHVAIIVSDMDAAYAHLRRNGVRHASTGPQRLPEWNPNAAGIRAFYFRDPDGHFLEILQFPPDKGSAPWHRTDALFLGVDHTAIVVSDTDRSLEFYRDMLQLSVAGGSENYDVEQEHLNNVFGARLRITTLRAGRGPGVELLEYLSPSDGLPAPADLRANDLAHWQTTMETDTLGGLLAAHARRLFRFVSPGAVALETSGAFSRQAALVRDPDGHGVVLATAGSER